MRFLVDFKTFRRNIFPPMVSWPSFIDTSVVNEFSLTRHCFEVVPHFPSCQILKYTPENHFDRANLETALEKAEDLCQQVRKICFNALVGEYDSVPSNFRQFEFSAKEFEHFKLC